MALGAGAPAGAARWFKWSVALAVLVQLALFGAATAPGLAGTADSGYYLHAAGTLRAAGHLLHPDGTAYRYWPPLYPVLVALGGSLAAVRLLHALCLAASLVVWSRLGRRLLPGALALVLPWAVALSTPWLVVSKFVWGETVFLALFAGYAAALFQWLRTPRWRWWGLATALGFLLPLGRTAGFFLLAGLALGLLLEWRKLTLKPRLLLGAHFGIGSLGGLAWHFYALLLAAPTVYRLNQGWTQFFSSMADYGFVLGRWLLPIRAGWRPDAPLVWAAVLVGLLAALWPWPQVSAPVPEQRNAAATALLWPHAFARVLWAGMGFFILMLLISTTFTRSAAGLHDAERYASVLFGPVLLLTLLQVSRIEQKFKPIGKSLKFLLLSLLAMWLLYSAGRAASNAWALRKLPLITGAMLR